MEDLFGKRFAVIRGFFTEEVLKPYEDKIRIVPVADATEEVRAVSSGRADAMFELMPVVNHVTERLGITNIQVGGAIDVKGSEPIEVGMAVSKKQAVLAAILDKGPGPGHGGRVAGPCAPNGSRARPRRRRNPWA